MNFDLHLAGQYALVMGGTRGADAAVVHGLCATGVRIMAAARRASRRDRGRPLLRRGPVDSRGSRPGALAAMPDAAATGC